MPTIIACPTCRARLNIPESLLGQKVVQCPSCSTTFEAAAVESGPAPPSVPLQLSLDDPTHSPPPPAPALKGAVEIKLSLDDGVPQGIPLPPGPAGSEPPARPLPPPRRDERDRPRWRDDDDMKECPNCGILVHREARRCHGCGERVRRYRDDDDRPRRPLRRDGEPGRGGLILTLGIVGLVLAFVFPPVGLVVSLCAWVMGHGDLGRIKRVEIDEQAAGSTWAGWMCGLIGSILGLLMILACASMWIALYEQNNPSRPPPPRFGAPPFKK